MRFPRLQKRGPIEAEQWHGYLPTHERFHAYKSVAPLKQDGSPLADVAGGFEFPRLQKRGPIEAAGAIRHTWTSSRCFHAYKSVAPLKLGVGVGAALAAARFHAYKSVAPLKRA